MLRYHIIKGNHILYFWFPRLPVFGLNITNVLKWGKNAKCSPVSEPD